MCARAPYFFFVIFNDVCPSCECAVHYNFVFMWGKGQYWEAEYFVKFSNFILIYKIITHCLDWCLYTYVQDCTMLAGCVLAVQGDSQAVTAVADASLKRNTVVPDQCLSTSLPCLGKVWFLDWSYN